MTLPPPIDAPGAVRYFAYGSNLSKQRMQQRTGDLPTAQAARLEDYRLTFNNRDGEVVYANIVPAVGGVVWGVVYSCDREAMSELDRHEGVALGCYRRILVAVETADGERLGAQTYVSDEQLREGRPDASYLELILTGAREHRLPEAYIRGLEVL